MASKTRWINRLETDSLPASNIPSRHDEIPFFNPRGCNCDPPFRQPRSPKRLFADAVLHTDSHAIAQGGDTRSFADGNPRTNRYPFARSHPAGAHTRTHAHSRSRPHRHASASYGGHTDAYSHTPPRGHTLAREA